jgi:hypothetical protein
MMKKMMILILLMASFLLNSVAFAKIGAVTQKVLLVRSGPGKNYKVIAKVKRGERLLVEGVRTNWAKLAWGREAWVSRSGISLKQRGTLSLEIDEQFVRWLIHDMKVNWAFIDRKPGNSIFVLIRMDSDRYGSPAEIRFIANNIAESYRFHTGEKGLLEIKILKPDAKFIHEVYFQATFK